MARDPDDDALTWGTETDPTHVDAPETPAPADLAHADEPGMSSALLVTLGVFGGVFLLFIVGWIISVQRSAITTAGLFNAFMYQLGEVLAIASPAAWFVGVLVLTRDRRPAVRVLWLLLGVVLLAPWSFILALGAK
jgi:hypothetical protein